MLYIINAMQFTLHLQLLTECRNRIYKGSPFLRRDCDVKVNNCVYILVIL